MGHSGGTAGHIIMKSDGEAAVVALRNAVAEYHGGRVSPEVPAKGESQSNGRIEEAGKTVREFTRVLKEQIEEKAKMALECNEAIVMWMIRWAAMLVSRFLVGKDGRTAYERLRGRTCKAVVVPVGEKVWYKRIRKGLEGEIRPKRSGLRGFGWVQRLGAPRRSSERPKESSRPVP